MAKKHRYPLLGDGLLGLEAWIGSKNLARIDAAEHIDQCNSDVEYPVWLCAYRRQRSQPPVVRRELRCTAQVVYPEFHGRPQGW